MATAVCLLGSGQRVLAADTDGAQLRLAGCPHVEVLASRGSGDTLGEDQGLSAPGVAFTSRLSQLVDGVKPWANPYNAVGVFSWNLRKLAPELINGVGAATQLSGRGLGAYHDSVVGGTRALSAKVASTLNTCKGATEIVLVGYSQGAQVTADVYERDLTALQRESISAVVLFGDPYFNGGDRAVDRGSFSGRRDGLLGRRPSFGNTGQTLVLSYCHSHDPICQGLLVRLGPTRTLDPGALTFRQHINYTKFGEPEQAADLVAKLPGVSVLPPAPIPTGPISGLASLLGARVTMTSSSAQLTTTDVDPNCPPIAPSYSAYNVNYSYSGNLTLSGSLAGGWALAATSGPQNAQRRSSFYAAYQDGQLVIVQGEVALLSPTNQSLWLEFGSLLPSPGLCAVPQAPPVATPIGQAYVLHADLLLSPPEVVAHGGRPQFQTTVDVTISATSATDAIVTILVPTDAIFAPT